MSSLPVRLVQLHCKRGSNCLLFGKRLPAQRNRYFCLSKFLCSMDEGSIGPVQLTLEEKLKEEFKPTFLEVTNESYKHSVPKGSESHFKVVIVSEAFEGKSPIQRHRSVNGLLSLELKESIHALSVQAKTPVQWEESGRAIANTPSCLGGSKADRK